MGKRWVIGVLVLLMFSCAGDKVPQPACFSHNLALNEKIKLNLNSRDLFSQVFYEEEGSEQLTTRNKKQ
ncbi:MAG: hypothetical protein HOB26_06080 [Flavobacteriales bacterium]|nr:hypothetical protein [Flavobacteriales bacterium]